MFSTRSRLGPMLFLAIGACSTGSEPTAPLPTTLPTLNLGNGVVITALGAGVVDLTGGVGGPADADFQFVAYRQADGTVTGHWRQSRMRAGGLADLAGFVTCVTTDPAFPGRARIGGHTPIVPPPCESARPCSTAARRGMLRPGAGKAGQHDR